ncbi:MAG TPA: hypothetical protein VHU19_08965 [Pyrinomonadaceae bacterium]|jgi:hypothetical protein|nr:hypothetical protein [Pyrinomonadaceae bacterium]
MSDYLWDKSGGPDAEVERLEELLGEFRHRPHPLELPSEITGRDDAWPRASRAYSPAWLAIAAVLLFVVLAGALFVLRRAAGTGVGRLEQNETASQDSRSTTPHDSPQQSASPQVAATRNDVGARGGSESVKRDVRDDSGGRGERTAKDERMVRQAVSRKPEHWPDGGESVLRQRGGLKSASSRPDEHRQVADATTRAVAESAPLEERQRLAKDDLMYVLRLTGLKLKEVQRRTRNVDGWKSAFDEQRTKQVTGKP